MTAGASRAGLLTESKWREGQSQESRPRSSQLKTNTNKTPNRTKTWTLSDKSTKLWRRSKSCAPAHPKPNALIRSSPAAQPFHLRFSYLKLRRGKKKKRKKVSKETPDTDGQTCSSPWGRGAGHRRQQHRESKTSFLITVDNSLAFHNASN